MQGQIPWYQSAILRQQIVQFLLAAFAFFNITTDFDLDATVAAIFAGIAGVIAIWTFVTRLIKPAPNLTATAAAKEQQLRIDGKIKGFALPGMLVSLAAVALIGCAALGIERPQSFEEKLAGGYATVAATRDSAATLLTAGKISVDDAKNVQTQADTARAGLDITRQVYANDPTSAENRLQAILVGLTAIEAYLRSKQ